MNVTLSCWPGLTCVCARTRQSTSISRNVLYAVSNALILSIGSNAVDVARRAASETATAHAK